MPASSTQQGNQSASSWLADTTIALVALLLTVLVSLTSLGLQLLWIKRNW